MNRAVSAGPLSGTFRAPASKSHAHRLLICAALGKTPVAVFCDTFSDDILATIDCLSAMGAKITVSGSKITVSPVFEHPKPNGLCTLKCRESGSTLRFLLPVVGALGLTAVFELEGRLPERPLHPFDTVLQSHGMNISQEGAKLFVSGQLTPGTFRLPGNVSSQYFSGLLFALPLLRGESTLEVEGPLQSAKYLEMTKTAVLQSGVQMTKTDAGFQIPGGQAYRLPSDLSAEGDWSGAAFFLCAGALSGAGILAEGLCDTSTQADQGVLDILRQFGAEVSVTNTGVFVRKGYLHGITIDAGPIPDLIPAVAAVAAFADGKTCITNAARLKLKESDRLHTVAETIKALGGCAEELPDGLVITGRKTLPGGTADSFGDHRIAMLAAILASGCEGDVTVQNAACTSKSYPNFWETLDVLKGGPA